MEKQRSAGSINPNAKAGDALPLPIGVTNKLFFILFFTTSYYVIRSWRDKMIASTPLHILTFTELVAVIVQIASFVYLIGFFGVEYMQNFLPKDEDEQKLQGGETNQVVRPSCGAFDNDEKTNTKKIESNETLQNMTDEEIALAVKKGQVQSYTLENVLKDCTRAASVRRGAMEMITGKSLQGLPLEGFNYESILGQCCELPVGFVQIPLGVAGPLLVDGQEYYVPMATTEGCLVASTNRGCKSIRVSGGANSVLIRDGMTRAPVVRFGSAVRAAELKFYVEDAEKYAKICQVFNSTSRFAKLRSLQCSLAGKNAYLRFTCSTGDAMGMNMVSKGTQNVLDFLQEEFPDMDVISISGNFCADKKAAAVNWIEGRGKSVVCEAVISGETVAKVLKTTVPALVELNMLKNLTGSAMAGAVGGFNAHASNIVSAVFLATGQDPAQNVESSHCLTMMEAINDGDDLHISVTMPCIEVGTVGGGTQLASQAACLNLLGVKGANRECPGANAQTLARIVAGAVLAGELSLMSAQAAGQLVGSHMKFNRASPSPTK